MTALPPAPVDFAWETQPWGATLVCTPLAAVARHAFTTRQLQLRSDRPEAWLQAAATVACDTAYLHRTRQVHGAAVHVVEHREQATIPPPPADALVTATPDTALAVVTADCVPILLADRFTGAVAAVHAGWRGTAANVAAEAIATLAIRFSTRPEHLVAAIGPSIGACCYQVGDELKASFVAAGHSAALVDAWFARDASGRFRLDLWRANRDLLEQAGVRAGHIHVAGLCTQTHVEVFESYRVEGAQAGRMAALIVAPSRQRRRQDAPVGRERSALS